MQPHKIFNSPRPNTRSRLFAAPMNWWPQWQLHWQQQEPPLHPATQRTARQVSIHDECCELAGQNLKLLRKLNPAWHPLWHVIVIAIDPSNSSRERCINLCAVPGCKWERKVLRRASSVGGFSSAKQILQSGHT
jgi:hypothetical protein